MPTDSHRIVIPASEALAKEPAREIAREYAHKETVKVVIVSVAGLFVALGANVAPDVPVLLENLANALVPIGLGLYARWQLGRNAKAQGEATRSAVYSSATVADIVTSVESEKRRPVGSTGPAQLGIACCVTGSVS